MTAPIIHHFSAFSVPLVPRPPALSSERHRFRHRAKCSSPTKRNISDHLDIWSGIVTHLLGTFGCGILNVSAISIIQQVHINQVSESTENLFQNVDRQSVWRANDEAALSAVNFFWEWLSWRKYDRTKGRASAVSVKNVWRWTFEERKVLKLWTKFNYETFPRWVLEAMQLLSGVESALLSSVDDCGTAGDIWKMRYDEIDVASVKIASFVSYLYRCSFYRSPSWARYRTASTVGHELSKKAPIEVSRWQQKIIVTHHWTANNVQHAVIIIAWKVGDGTGETWQWVQRHCMSFAVVHWVTEVVTMALLRWRAERFRL